MRAKRFDRSQAVERAAQYVARGKIARALEMYRDVVAHHPKDAHSWLRIGQLCRQSGCLEDAFSAFTEAARCYRQTGFDLKAAAAFERALRLLPEPTVSMELGELYAEMGSAVNARHAYESAVELYRQTRRSREALMAQCRLVELDPSDAVRRLALARAYVEHGLMDEAGEHYKMACAQLKQAHSPMLLDVAMEWRALMAENGATTEGARLARGSNRHVINRADTATGRQREQPNIEQLFAQADAYMRRGRQDRAMPLLETVLRHDPEYMPAQIAIKDILIARGQSRQAVTILMQLAIKAAQDRDRERALRHLLEARRIAPDIPQIIELARKINRSLG